MHSDTSPLALGYATPAMLGRAFGTLAAARPVYDDTFLQVPMILRRADVLAALRSPEIYSNRCFSVGPLVASPIALDGAQHARIRRVYNRFFAPAAVARYEAEVVEPVARALIEDLAGEPSVELIAGFATRLPIAVMSRLLELPADAMERTQRWTQALISWIVAPFRPEVVEAGQQAEQSLRGFVRPRIEAELEHPGASLLGEIVRGVQAEGDGTVAECENTAMSLVVAAYETTTAMLASVLGALLLHPDLLAQARADRQRLAPTLEEAMRWGNVVPFLLRALTRDVTLDGVTLAAGSVVALCTTSVNYDAELHPDPERLDITRKQSHVTFGSGPHYCVGAPLARIEARVGLALLLDRFPELRLDPTRPPEFRFGARGITMFVPDALHVLRG